MKIINGAYPPNIDEIRKYLPIHDKVVFCWGDLLFNPNNLRIDPALMAHEQVHFDQQMRYGKNSFWQNFTLPKYRIGKWWDRYLKNYAFRLSQEIPAYQKQYWEYCKVLKDKNDQNRMAIMLAKDLSSPLYGNLISTENAIKAIKEEKLYDFKVSELIDKRNSVIIKKQ